MARDLSIILPCLNEQDNLVELHDRISATVSTIGIDAEIIVIDDGSTDRTARVAKRLATTGAIPVVVVKHPTNRGIFQSWKSGLAAASGDFVVFMDSDLQNPPEAIAELWSRMQRRDSHIVQAVRMTTNGLDRKRSRSTAGLNALLNVMYRDNARDSKSGFFIAPKSVAEDIVNINGHYAYPHTFVRLSALSRGYTCDEILTPFHPRTKGTSIFEDGRLFRVYLHVFADLLKGLPEFRRREHPARRALLEFADQFEERERYSGLRKLRLDLYYATMPLHAWLLRRSSKAVFIALRKTQFASADQLRDFQNRQLARLVWHAYVNVAYYRDAMDAAGVTPEQIRTVDDIGLLPMLTKPALASNVHYSMFARNPDWKKIHKIVTSGSTGNPSTSYGEQAQLEIRAGTTLRAAEWTGWRFGDRQMRLWHQTLGMNWSQAIREKFDAWLLKRRFVPAFELTEESLVKLITLIEDYKPVLIDGYAESLNFVASYASSGRSIAHRPKGVMSSAQMLTAQTRTQIENALGTHVYDKYGAREFSGIAYECDAGSQHVMAESYIVELLASGKPAKVGQTAEVVITDLNNFAVPMLRFRIGDLAERSAQTTCACGRSMPTIGKIQGRTQALVHCANGRWIPGTFFAHFFKEYEDQIRFFQVVQLERGAFELLIVKNDTWNAEGWGTVLVDLAEYVGDTVIDVSFVDEIPLLRTGKRTPVISKVAFDFQLS